MTQFITTTSRRGSIISLSENHVAAWSGNLMQTDSICVFLGLRNDLYCVEWGVKLYSLTHRTRVLGYSSPSKLYRVIFLPIDVIATFDFPVANFHCISFAANCRIVGIYQNTGLRDFICNLPAAWK